ncbi:MAG: hypothetical protein WC455_15370 [Dehalococcoidia bacterium]|jgi:hypothetical protein
MGIRSTRSYKEVSALRAELEKVKGELVEAVKVGNQAIESFDEVNHLTEKLEQVRAEEAEHIDISPVEGCECALCKARTELEKVKGELVSAVGTTELYTRQFLASQERIRELSRGCEGCDATVVTIQQLQQQNGKLREVASSVLAWEVEIGADCKSEDCDTCETVGLCRLTKAARVALQEPVVPTSTIQCHHVADTSKMIPEQPQAEGE